MGKVKPASCATLALLMALSPLAQAWQARGGARTQVFQPHNMGMRPGEGGGGVQRPVPPRPEPPPRPPEPRPEPGPGPGPKPYPPGPGPMPPPPPPRPMPPPPPPPPYHYHDGWYDPVVAGVVVGTTTALVIGAVVNSVPANCVPVLVNGLTYQQCGSTWYQPQYVGTRLQYVVVPPPM